MLQTAVRYSVLSGSWTPAALNPICWIEARKQNTCFQTITGTTAVTDTSVCGTILDLSGNGNKLAARANDTTRPSWNAGAYPYILFDGTNDLIQTASSLGLYANAGGASVFLALRATTTPDLGDTVAAEANAGSNQAAAQQIGVDATTATSSRFFWRDDSAGTASGIPATNVYDGVDHVYGIVDGVTTLTGYLDGVKGSPLSVTRPGGVMTITVFAVGGLGRATPSAWAPFRLYSMVVVRRQLNNNETRLLMKYLGKTCGRNL